MQLKELIRKKREGGKHTPEELAAIVNGYVAGEVKDYQLAAWLMAVYFKRLDEEELSELTRLMWRSGNTISRSQSDAYWVDKHSTGGVGDKTSMILVPLVNAVCDRVLGKGKVKIPMISGRGLGHSGGTLDKLESIPGFSPHLSPENVLRLLEKNGSVMMGQSATIAPADGLIYALRDATATVECVDLIVASILSKKLSENINGLVIDVKCGSGAFMESTERARELANGLVKQAGRMNVEAVAILTLMDEPLGWSAGNFIEMEECADFLSNVSAEPGLREVTLTLAGWMISLASRKQISVGEARAECETELTHSRGIQNFREMLTAQGGDWEAFERLRATWRNELLKFPVTATQEGYLHQIGARDFGVLIGALGGGRDTKESKIDPFVGVEFRKKVGDRIEVGQEIGTVFYRRDSDFPVIKEAVGRAIQIERGPVTKKPWVLECLQGDT